MFILSQCVMSVVLPFKYIALLLMDPTEVLATAVWASLAWLKHADDCL